MFNNHAPQAFPAFAVIWVMLGFAFSGFLYLSKNAALKRKIWPYASVAASLLFIGFAWTMGVPHEGFFFMVPFVALITWINVRAMKFCDACGKTVRTQNPFSPPKFCPKCGSALHK